MADDSTQTDPKGKSKLKGCLVWGGAIFLGLVLITAIFGDPAERDSNSVSNNVASEKNEAAVERIEVTANQITQAFDANELAAERRFQDTPIRVTGALLNISAGLGENSTIRVGKSSDYEFQGVQASIDADHADWVASLSKGQEVVLLCAGAGEILGQAVLDDCAPESAAE